MSFLLRRALSTTSEAGPSFIPPVSSVVNTLPTQVRRRRAERPPHAATSPSPLSDPDLLLPSGRTPKRIPWKLEEEFQRLRSRGQFKGDEASGRRAFLLGTVAWRSRHRGIKNDKAEFLADAAGEVELSQPPEIVGQRVYLPNVQIQLRRNFTPSDQPYDPYVATFRIPISMTKTDLRSYLLAVYDLKVTFIRTDIYYGSIERVRSNPPTNRKERLKGSRYNYKRAVVGLVDPFHYPDDVDELKARAVAAQDGAAVWGDPEILLKAVKEREKWFEDYLNWSQMETYHRDQKLRPSIDPRRETRRGPSVVSCMRKGTSLR